MKRIIILLAIFSLVIMAILIPILIKNTSSVPYLWYASLQAREERGVYIITVSDVGEKKTVHFSSSGEVLKTKGIKLIAAEDPQAFVGMKWSDIVAQHGEPHADVGSGFYIPSYITNDAFLITFQLDDNDVVTEVHIEDLIRERGQNG